MDYMEWIVDLLPVLAIIGWVGKVYLRERRTAMNDLLDKLTEQLERARLDRLDAQAKILLDGGNSLDDLVIVQRPGFHDEVMTKAQLRLMSKPVAARTNRLARFLKSVAALALLLIVAGVANAQAPPAWQSTGQAKAKRDADARYRAMIQQRIKDAEAKAKANGIALGTYETPDMAANRRQQEAAAAVEVSPPTILYDAHVVEWSALFVRKAAPTIRGSAFTR